MEIKRDLYLNRLISRRNNGLIKIITGIRRCGKSYLLFNLYCDYLLSIGVPANNIIKIPLDNEEFIHLCDPSKLSLYIRERTEDDSQNYYVFIDEAQYAISKEELRSSDTPIRLYYVLNGLLRKRNVDVYITGSNSKFLSSDVMTEFRGRGDEVHVAPLSFSEYFPASGKDKSEAWNDYLYYGGLPHILAEPDDEAKSRYLDRLNREIFLRDVSERYDIRDEGAIVSLMKVLASSVGSLTNAQRISDTFKSSGDKGLSMPTISNYLKYLQESSLIQKAERYDIKGRRYISTPCKYYYTDLGLRNALLNFRQFEKNHLMENAIFNELIYRGYSVDVGIVDVRKSEDGKRIHSQLEVDFVVNQASARYYIQSAYSIPDKEKMDQEQASLVRIPDSFKKIIVVDGYSPIWRNENGVTIMGIFDFLFDGNSLNF